jgi:hypothetical protein
MSRVVHHNANDRNLTGDTASALYKSREEAPEVANYNYEAVVNLECGTGFTDLNAWDSDRPLQSLHMFQDDTRFQEQGLPSVESLLIDAYHSVVLDAGDKLLMCLNMLRDGHRVQYPADVEYGELFKDTLWNRVSDPETNLPADHRRNALELLSYYHKNNHVLRGTAGSDGQ